MTRDTFAARQRVMRFLELKQQRHPSVRRIASHLAKTTSVVEIVYERERRADMAPVIAEAAAMCLGAWFGGIVCTPGQLWYRVDPQSGFEPIPADPAPATSTQGGAGTTIQYASPGAELARSVVKQKSGPQRVQRLRHWNKPLPASCPRCARALGSTNRSRASPKLPLAGHALVVGGAIVAFGLYAGSGLAIRSYMFVRASALAILLLPVLVVPGVIFCWLASRLPRILWLKCSRCGWKERFAWR